MPDVTFLCDCKCLFGRYIRDGEPWVAKCKLCGAKVTNATGPNGELKPVTLRLPNDQYDYISPVDGSHIASKRAHRDHLKKHGLIELGNEKPDLSKPFTPSVPLDSIKAEMRNQLERMKSDGTWRER
jgi:hypothetical protein